jgi:hypothetical protein
VTHGTIAAKLAKCCRFFGASMGSETGLGAGSGLSVLQQLQFARRNGEFRKPAIQAGQNALGNIHGRNPQFFQVGQTDGQLAIQSL